MVAIKDLLMILVAIPVMAGISTAAPVETGVYPASKIIERDRISQSMLRLILSAIR